MNLGHSKLREGEREKEREREREWEREREKGVRDSDKGQRGEVRDGE
jgi:hypothetical protein